VAGIAKLLLFVFDCQEASGPHQNSDGSLFPDPERLVCYPFPFFYAIIPTVELAAISPVVAEKVPTRNIW